MLYNLYLFYCSLLLQVKAYLKFVNILEVIICFATTYVIFFLLDSAFLKRRSVLYPFGLSVYFTLLASLTLLGRQPKTQSSLDTLFATYTLAVSGSLWAFHAIVFNILLFIPLGILLLRYFEKSKWFSFFLLVIPVTVEILQLVTSRGLFELSDIINNVLGGILGLIIAIIIKKRARLKGFVSNFLEGKNGS